MRRMAFGSSMSAVATIHCPAKPNTERPAIGWASIGRADWSRPLLTGSSGSTRPNIMTSQENIYVVLILLGCRGLLLELQQARERAPRPHEVFGAVQATSDRLDILINNAGIGTASPVRPAPRSLKPSPGPLEIFADGLVCSPLTRYRSRRSGLSVVGIVMPMVGSSAPGSRTPSRVATGPGKFRVTTEAATQL